MTSSRLSTWCFVAFSTCAVSLSACQKVGGSSPLPVPTATPTGAPSPSACNPVSNDPATVIVAMAAGISSVNDPKYGTIYGYGVVDAYNEPPFQAASISKTSAGQPITPQNTLQFYNAEPGGSPTLHSAYGFAAKFPSTPYRFPSPAPSPTGTSIGHANWFTGRIGAPADAICYSQIFKLQTGVFYFGDYDYYNLQPYRDVLIVGTPSPKTLRETSHAAIRKILK
jgi:hypothetical protein